MADVTNPRNSANNGTTTPATPGSITAIAGNLLVVVIGVLGTSPTIATPTGGGTWQVAQNRSGVQESFGLFCLPNNAGGAINPSSVLGGTINGWIAEIFEFSATGANCALQGSALSNQAIAQMPNVFAGVAGQMAPSQLFCYTIVRNTSTQIIQNSGLSPINQQGMPVGSSPATWLNSQLPQSGVQNMSLDFFWGTNLGQGAGPYPVGQGLCSSAVTSTQIGAWFNAAISPTQVAGNIGGTEGIYVPQFYQGMVGG